MEEIRRLERREKLSIGEWVRRILPEARSRQPVQSPKHKLKAIRKAAEHSFPTAEIDQMLAEIERGYHQSHQ